MYLKRSIEFPEKKSFFLLGPRQVGKSTLIKHRFTKNIWELNLLLDEVFLRYSNDPSLFRKEAEFKIKNQNIQVIFVDEIQRLPTLLNEVQYLIQKYPDTQFILTGSSARKLKRGGANLLGGRAVERFLFPLTYHEIGASFDLEETLKFGSLPPILAMNREDKIDTLNAYVSTYLREEIQSEGIVRKLGSFSRFLDMAAAQSTELLNFAAISRECQLPASTIQSYYQILEDTLVGFKLEPWKKSLRHRLSQQPKFYFFDTGVVNAIRKSLTAPLKQPFKGKLFEQFIVLETYRYFKYSKTEANLFFWRTSHGAELDLLLEKHGNFIAAIEIKSSSNVALADLSGLKSFLKNHPDCPAYVVADVPNSYELDQGIQVLSWKDYLERVMLRLVAV